MLGKEMKERLVVTQNGKVYSLEREIKTNIYSAGEKEVLTLSINHNPSEEQLSFARKNQHYINRITSNEIISSGIGMAESICEVFRQPL